MTDQHSLDFFRAIVQAVPENQTPVLYLSQVDTGYILENFLGSRLKTFRGSLRIFSSCDTAVRFITENIARPAMRPVEIKIITVPSNLGH